MKMKNINVNDKFNKIDQFKQFGSSHTKKNFLKNTKLYKKEVISRTGKAIFRKESITTTKKHSDVENGTRDPWGERQKRYHLSYRPLTNGHQEAFLWRRMKFSIRETPSFQKQLERVNFEFIFVLKEGGFELIERINTNCAFR